MNYYDSVFPFRLVKMNRNIFDTLNEAIEDIEYSQYIGDQDLVILPPDNDPYASDEEVGDDNIGLAGNLDLPADVTGGLEIHRYDADDDKDDEDVELNPKENKRNWREGDRVFEDDWIGEKRYSNVIEDFPQLLDMSELELYKLFFDDEIEQLFVECSKRYATQKNDQSFTFDTPDLWDFFNIIALSSHNTRPQFNLFWSMDEDTSCPLVRELMSRNYFRKVKAYLHVCNNNNVSADDKWAT